jgi:acetyltransferase-like isoleucine patch superfamily enzyme
MTRGVIDAAEIVTGARVSLGSTARILARDVSLGDGVVIEDDVVLCCDSLAIGPDTRVRAGTRIVAPEIRLGHGCSVGLRLDAELNDYLHVGHRSDLGREIRIAGRGVSIGDHAWLTDAIVVGGGGARGPRSFLTNGHRSAVMDRCFINVSETVTIGDDTALSNGVTVLTHSLWHPALLGGTVVFAPAKIGDRNILYVNAVIAPGVTTGNDVTVAAGALLLQDVPDGSTAVGNPARVIKTVPAVPRELDDERKDRLIREVLRSYAETLPVKGVTVTPSGDPDVVCASLDGRAAVIRYLPATTRGGASADITIAFGAGAPLAGRCHFDLAAATMTGEPSPLSEDLRDHLRRRTIRIFTDRPFSPLPPANLARLRERLRAS